MPYAETAETAHRWATERAIDCWVWYANDLTSEDLHALEPSVIRVRTDGASWVLVLPRGLEPAAVDRSLADITVSGDAPNL